MKKLIITAFAALLFAGIFAIVPAKAQTVDTTRDCDTVAIIKCGSMTDSELRADYDKNEYGDLPKVFSTFGISRSDLSGFQDGIVWKDGRVTVDGKVVATDATTAGRWFNPKSDMTRIPDTDRAFKMSTSHFVDDGQIAFVKMVDGKFKFAVIKTCGNPVNAVPKEQPKPKPEPKPQPKPAVECDELTIVRVKESSDADLPQFKFTVTAKPDDSQVKGYQFRVFDSEGRLVSTIDDGDGEHIFTVKTPGTYKVIGFVITDKEITSATCEGTFTLQEEKPEEKPPQVLEEQVVPVAQVTEGKGEARIIPETGAAQVLGAGAGISTVTAAGWYYVRSRRNFLSSFFNK